MSVDRRDTGESGTAEEWEGRPADGTDLAGRDRTGRATCRALRVTAVVCAVGWFAFALLHLLLVLGLPLGALTLGGRDDVLPLAMRPISAGMVVVWSWCGWSYLAYTDVVPSRVEHRRLRGRLIVMEAWLLAASVFNLFFTTSPAERYGTGTVTVVVLVLTTAVLVGSSPRAQALVLPRARCGTRA